MIVITTLPQKAMMVSPCDNWGAESQKDLRLKSGTNFENQIDILEVFSTQDVS